MIDRVLDAALSESRYAWTRIRRHSGTSAIIALTIGAAAGPLTLALGLAHPPTLASSGIAAPQDLVRITGAMERPGGASPSGSGLSYPEFVHLAKYARTLGGLVASARTTGEIEIGASRKAVPAALVSDRYFDVLGVSMALGQPIRASGSSETVINPVAVIGEELWRSEFAGDPRVIGRVIRFNDFAVTIVGVAARHFVGLRTRSPEQLWLPLSLQPHFALDVPPLDAWDAHEFAVVGRPTRGLGPAQVQADVAGLSRQLAEQQPAELRNRRLGAESLERAAPRRGDDAAAGLQTATWLLGAILLALACFNVAGILLVRAVSEEQSTAVRSALGLSFGRLIAGALAESAVLSVAGLAAACVWGGWLLDIIRVQSGGEISGTLDWQVIATIGSIAIGVALGFVTLPAMFWRHLNVAQALTTGGRSERRQTRTLRNALVALQIAFSITVASTALILGRSIGQLRRADVGFNTRSLYSVSVDFRHSSRDAATLAATHADVRRAVLGVNGVRAAGFGRSPLLVNAVPMTDRVAIDGGDGKRIPTEWVGPGYFDALGVRVVAGREFSDVDARGASLVVLVNETMARQSWPGASALGRQVRLFDPRGAESTATVVGVIRDYVTDYVGVGVEPRLFRSTVQAPVIIGYYYVRLDGGASNARDVGRAIRRVLPMSPTTPTVLAVDEVREDAMSFLKNALLVANLLGALALILAATGIYALQSYVVQRRLREFGIRMALGSSRRRIAGVVATDAMRVAGTGGLLAIPLILVVMQLLRILTFGTGMLDPFVLAGVFAALAVVVVGGSLVPVVNAMRANPLESIR